MKKSIKRKKQSRAGNSMVEVLVAFLIVMLMMAMFSKIITTSITFLNKSRQIIENTEDFNEKYYKTAERTKRTDISGELSLKLNKEKTSTNNTHSRDTTLKLTKGILQKYTDEDTKIARYSIKVEQDEESEEEIKTD